MEVGKWADVLKGCLNSTGRTVPSYKSVIVNQRATTRDRNKGQPGHFRIGSKFHSWHNWGSSSNLYRSSPKEYGDYCKIPLSSGGNGTYRCIRIHGQVVNATNDTLLPVAVVDFCVEIQTGITVEQKSLIVFTEVET